ncbi:hypothetical protein EK21DRAFT_119674 [Setomelanomma holmii]|uniref:Uncharacterized protein n=1 Tax=Setomelanomma holmii TaxID=210430 RepID=A0A9P4LES1_9PLEO|nr:hypothetical protein EK21DRAFT_119674 [Setomelanomma holmii]
MVRVYVNTGPRPDDASPNQSAVPSDNIFDFLSTWIKHPISLLAAAAKHNAGFSGSLVLHWLFPEKGYFTNDSDLDMYIPCRRKAVEDIVHVLNFSGVKWQNVLQPKVEELTQHGVTLVPFMTVFLAVEYLKKLVTPNTMWNRTSDVQKRQAIVILDRYLETRLDNSPQSLVFKRQFFNALETMIAGENTRYSMEDAYNHVYVIRAISDHAEPEICEPYAIGSIVETLCEVITHYNYKTSPFSLSKDGWGPGQTKEVTLVVETLFDFESGEQPEEDEQDEEEDQEDEEEDQEDEEEEDEKKKKKRLFLGHIRSKWKEQDLAEPVVLSIIRRNLVIEGGLAT